MIGYRDVLHSQEKRGKKICLTREEIETFGKILEDLESVSEHCESELGDAVQKLSCLTTDEISLQFRLGFSDSTRKTDSDILIDDSNTFAKFATAISMVISSAKEMEAYDIRDNSQRIERNITRTMETIAKTLVENGFEPPKSPRFPHLENKLNEETDDFLKVSSDDSTDAPSQTLLYTVRNYVIVRELRDKQRLFVRDLGHLSSEQC